VEPETEGATLCEEWEKELGSTRDENDKTHRASLGNYILPHGGATRGTEHLGEAAIPGSKKFKFSQLGEYWGLDGSGSNLNTKKFLVQTKCVQSQGAHGAPRPPSFKHLAQGVSNNTCTNPVSGLVQRIQRPVVNTITPKVSETCDDNINHPVNTTKPVVLVDGLLQTTQRPVVNTNVAQCPVVSEDGPLSATLLPVVHNNQAHGVSVNCDYNLVPSDKMNGAQYAIRREVIEVMNTAPIIPLRSPCNVAITPLVQDATSPSQSDPEDGLQYEIRRNILEGRIQAGAGEVCLEFENRSTCQGELTRPPVLPVLPIQDSEDKLNTCPTPPPIIKGGGGGRT
jgi:hypothetical protein